ncbi:MAG: hypothetical protein J0L63_04615 [Anaerolineae bacterium]|nr:hypothetical protein [Anaerolineae bacterium]
MMNQPLVLAVDGGQSSTMAMVATHNGEIVGVGLAGPSNHIHEPGGPERLRNALTQSIQEALAAAQHSPDAVQHACFGMTGAMEMAADIGQELLPHTTIQSLHDIVTALAGASLAQPGVVVIAGTGAIAYGRLADGREAKAGGWGYIMGDEGSGYDIGRAALRAATQGSDGRAPATMLTQLIPAQLGVADLTAVHKLIYSGALTRPQIARLTVSVVRADQQGDAAARALLEEAGQHLAAAALAVINHLGLSEKGIDVFPTGGIFEASERVNTAFQQAVTQGSPAAAVKMAAFPPIIGGLLLALQAAGSAIDTALINHLRASFPQAAASKHKAREQEAD